MSRQMLAFVLIALIACFAGACAPAPAPEAPAEEVTTEEATGEEVSGEEGAEEATEEVTTDGVDADLRSLACKSLVVTEDSGLAIPVVSDLDAALVDLLGDIEAYRYVYWVYFTNFQKHEDELLSCLRLFGRSTNNGADNFLAIDNGGLPLKGDCQQLGTDDNPISMFWATEMIHDVNGASQIESAYLTFEDTGYIRCNLSVADSVKEFHEKIGVPKPDGNFSKEDVDQIAAGIEHLINEQPWVLPTFTLIVAGEALNTDADTNLAVHYEPQVDSVSPITFLLPMKPSNGTFAARFGEYPVNLDEMYQPADPTDNACVYDRGAKYYWWADFSGVNGQRQFPVSFHHLLMGNTTQDIEMCINVTPDTYPQNVEVWTGDATLYIGCTPDGDGVCTPGFTGKLYEVIIDPLNSKPQVGCC